MMIWLAIGLAQAGDEHTEMLRTMYSLPDPGAAAALSGTIGFGVGHFYAEEPGRGVLHFIFQAVATGLVIGGPSLRPTSRPTPPLRGR